MPKTLVASEAFRTTSPGFCANLAGSSYLAAANGNVRHVVHELSHLSLDQRSLARDVSVISTGEVNLSHNVTDRTSASEMRHH